MQILLNLSGLVYLDSSGIEDLVHTYMSVIKSGGEMNVVGLTDKVEEILKITQLYQVFQEFKDERSRCRVFRATAASVRRCWRFSGPAKIDRTKEEKQ